MLNRPSGGRCPSCPAYNQGVVGFMGDGDGDMAQDVMFVAEALGQEEATQLKALVGGAGFLLGRVMNRKGYKRSDFNYQNILRCKPFKNQIRYKSGDYLAWVPGAMDHCEPYLDVQIERRQPKCIVALGVTAFQRLTGQSLTIEAARGYPFRDRKNRTWVIPTFHPSHLLRGMQHLSTAMILDIEKAVKVAHTDFSIETPNILEDPALAQWEEWLQYAEARIRAGYPLASDIETPYKSDKEEDELDSGEALLNQIDRVSFAVDGDTAVSVLWQLPYLIGIRHLLKVAAEVGTVLFWNRPFDRPEIMQNLGMHIPIERTRDTMDAYHVLFNSLPRKLGFATSLLPSSWRLAAWKHLSSVSPAFYNGVDSLVLWRNDYDILRALKSSGQLDTFNLVCRDLDPVLDFMTSQGMLIDTAARDNLSAVLDEEMAKMKGVMEGIVPPGVKSTQVWTSLKNAEKGVALLRGRNEVRPEATLFPVPGKVKEGTCTACGAHPVTKTHVTRKTLKPVISSEVTEESAATVAAE